MSEESCRLQRGACGSQAGEPFEGEREVLGEAKLTKELAALLEVLPGIVDGPLFERCEAEVEERDRLSVAGVLLEVEAQAQLGELTRA